ncbi:MAG: hypothetical protein ACUVV5_03470 [Candidatus Aminicenantales bacterium]
MSGKRRFHLVFAFALMMVVLDLPVILFGQDDFLKVEASIVPRRLARSQEGQVVLKLSLREGVSISPYPNFIIEFQPCPELVFPKNFFTATDLEIEILDIEGEKALNFREPVRIPFTVSLEAKKGSYILEGRIKYFARSKKENWCVKSLTKFFVPFATRAARIRR